MAGEGSKSSGEVGEKLASTLLKKIGWENGIHNVTIKCTNRNHINSQKNSRTTHGEDQIFLYQNPFHDNRTDFVHISVKNTINKYPEESTLKSLFKGHIKELSEIISCAKHSPELHEISSHFEARSQHNHSGLLIWLQNDLNGIEFNIKPILANTAKIEFDCDSPIHIIDNARASFLLKVVENLEKKSTHAKHEFFYPRIGTGLTESDMRTGSKIPLELIASDIVPAVITTAQGREFVLYADEQFDKDSYTTLIDYALKFNTSLLQTIHIGVPDYNPAQNEKEAQTVRAAFSNRTEKIIPFSFNHSILNLLREE